MADSVAIPLLRGLLADTEQFANLRPRVVAEAQAGDRPLDVAVDVLATGDEGLELSLEVASHASTVVDGEAVRQPELADGLDLAAEDETLEEGGLDGLHHLWCKWCHPDWDASPIGPGVGTPFVAWCGVRAVILARWLSDETPPGACPRCADPATACVTCGGS